MGGRGDLDESARQQAASNLLMKSYAMIFLGIVMREHLPQLQLKEELTDEVYVLPAIIQAIRQNLKSITLEELTRQFGMSESELKRYIVRESGYTYRYLLRGSAAEKGGGAATEYQPEHGENYGGNRV